MVIDKPKICHEKVVNDNKIYISAYANFSLQKKLNK